MFQSGIAEGLKRAEGWKKNDDGSVTVCLGYRPEDGTYEWATFYPESSIAEGEKRERERVLRIINVMVDPENDAIKAGLSVESLEGAYIGATDLRRRISEGA